MTKLRAGGQTKLTPTVAARIVQTLGLGHYAEVAAASAGISPATYYRWMQRGRLEAGLYRRFREAVQAAEVEAEQAALTVVLQAVREDWRAAAWYLERRAPHRWGNRQMTTLTTDPVAPPRIIVEIHPSHEIKSV